MRGKVDRTSSSQRRSRRSSADTTASSDVSTRSTVIRSRGPSNRWETQSATSVGSTSRARHRRGAREEDEADNNGGDSYLDGSDDARSEASRYSYASSQFAPRSVYAEEASFLSQAMLGMSRQSLAGGGDGSVRSRRSARPASSVGGRSPQGRSHSTAGGGDRDDDADRVSLRSGTRARSSTRGHSALGASRSHISVDGYAREPTATTTTTTARAHPAPSTASGPTASRRPGTSRRGPSAPPTSTSHLTSTSLRTVDVTGPAGAAKNGRLRQLLSRARSTTLLDSNDGTVFDRSATAATGTSGTGAPPPLTRSASGSASALFSARGPLGDGMTSPCSSSTTATTRSQHGGRLAAAGAGGAGELGTPNSGSLGRRPSTHTVGLDSSSSGTRRSNERLRLAAALNPQSANPLADRNSISVTAPTSVSADGSRPGRGKSAAGKGRGGILSYAHSGLARRPVLVWRQPFRVTAMAVSVSGRLYTGGDANGAIVAWDSRTGAVEYILEGHQAAVLALELLATQDLLLSASADHSARLWSLQTLQTLYSFEGHSGLVSCVAYAWVEDLESMAFFTGSDDSTVRLWSIERSGAAGGRAEGGVASCLHVFRGHRRPVNALCCLEDATHVLSGDGEGVMRVWSMQAQKCVTTLSAHEGEVTAIQQLHILSGASANATAAAGEDGVAVYIATAGNGVGGARGGCVRLWQANWMHTTVLLAELCVPDLIPSVRCVLTYHHFLFLGGNHGELMLWDTSTGDVTALFVFHTQAVGALTLHNNQLCSCSFDHQIARWDVLDLFGSDQQTVVPYQPYVTGAFRHASVFLGGSGGATPQTLALLRGSQTSSRRAEALVASTWRHGDQEDGGSTGGPGEEQNGASAEGDGGATAGSAGMTGTAARRRRLAAAAAFGQKDVSAKEAAETYAELPLAFVLDQLGTSRFTGFFYLDIVVSITFCVVFCVLFAQLYPIAESFFVLAGLEAQIANFPLPSLREPRTFFSINSAQWFFRWMDVTAQHLWRDRAQTSMFPAMSGNNVLLSTMRLRVKRVSCDSCQWNPAVVGSTTNVSDDTMTPIARPIAETVRCEKVAHRCYADWNMPGVRESTIPYLCPMSSTCYQNQAYLNVSAMAIDAGVDPDVGFTYSAQAHRRDYSSILSSFSRGGYFVDFFYTDSFTTLRRQLAALETLGFVDDVSTRLADVSVFTYNPNTDLFSASDFTCEVPSAGAWLCSVRSDAFEVYNNETMQPRLACHIVLFLLALVMAAMTVWKTVKAVRTQRLTRRVLSILVWVDAVVTVLLIVLTAYFFRWMHVSASVSVRELVEVTAADRRADLIAANSQQRAQLTQVADAYRIFLRLAGVTAIGMGVRVLASFSALSYWRFFMDVFRRARPLVIGFMVMHTVLLLGFAQAAHLLFGRTLLEYSTLGQSFMALVHRQWGSGDAINSIEATLTERWTSAVFFFFFFFIVFDFVAVSFFVAVLVNSYTETAKATAVIPLTQTVWKRAHDVRYRLRWEALRRSWVVQHLRHAARRIRLWARRRRREGRVRRVRSSLAGPAQSIVLGNSVASGLPGGGNESVVSSNAPLLSNASSAWGDEEAEAELMDGADALDERRLLRLLRLKLEGVGLGDGVEDEDAQNGGASVAAMSDGVLSASIDFSGRWGSTGGPGGADLGGSFSTLSSSTTNSALSGGGRYARGPPASAMERRGRTRPNVLHGWSASEASAGGGDGRHSHTYHRNNGSGGEASYVSDGSRPLTTSTARDTSAFNRHLPLGRRSNASGTAARSHGGANSSVVVARMHQKQQERAHRLSTVMVRKTDIAFVLAAVVEEATRGTARASETVDTFMDAYSRSFVNHIWEDLAWHYHYVHRSENSRESATKEINLRARVEAALVVLGPSFALVDSAQQQLEAQEGHLWPLVQALEQHGDTMRLNKLNNMNANGPGEGGSGGGGGAASTVSGSSTRAMYGQSH